MRSQGWMGVMAAVLAAFLCAWGACRGRPVEGQDADGTLEASVEDAGPRDAALEKPEYDDTWCGDDIPFPRMDPNAECIPNPDQEEMGDWSWDGGRWVAWYENRVVSGAHIVVYDIEEKKSFDLVYPDTFPRTPRVHGDRLVYIDLVGWPSGTKTQAIHEYDLALGTEVRAVTFDHPDRFEILAYWPPYVVLVNSRNMYAEVRSLDTNEATKISDPGHHIQGVWMTDRYVSWTADPPEGSSGWSTDTFYLDLETWEIHRITSVGAQWDTCVDGHRIVWGDTRRSGPPRETGWRGWDVYLYDIETGEERLLSDDPYDQVSPKIKGNLVVWEDYRFTRGRFWESCASQVYVYDISTGIGRLVTRYPWIWHVVSPVYGGKVLVWQAGPTIWFFHGELCFFDLVAMGILDEAGEHVLPE